MSRFDEQARDLKWSGDAAVELSRTLLPLVQSEGSSPTTVDCRTDMCRFEVKNRDENAYHKAFSNTLHQRVWNSGMMLLRSPADPTTLVVYIAKKGGEIPAPPPELGEP